MVVEAKLNQYITIILISAKRIKDEIFGLFAVSSRKRRGNPKDLSSGGKTF